MSNKVVPQLDVGSLSVRGLAAFTPLLSALSADDVAPLAIVQLENLGSLFHVNGPYALMVPDLLCRCSSVRMDRIGMMIGWRKGDTASIVSQTAGGQAIALMCFCLVNTCRHQEVGAVLSDLCERVLPKSLARSSIAQLTAVVNVLAPKLQAIGFGNILAKHVVRIQDAYHHIGKTLPRGFFDSLTRESAVDFYYALSRLSSEEGIILRISGLHAMAHIMMVVLVMFPDNVRITTNDLILQEGYSPLIYLEIETRHVGNDHTMFSTERKLEVSPTGPILADFITRDVGEWTVPYHFGWTGHVADALGIAFADIGIRLSDRLKTACCDLILSSLHALSRWSFTNENDLPLNGFSDLLGAEPYQRCYHVCRNIFGATPTGSHSNTRTAYRHLVKIFNSATEPTIRCSCVGIVACDLTHGWESGFKRAKSRSERCCLKRVLWRVILSALSRGFKALLVEAGPHATTIFDIHDLNEYNICLPLTNEFFIAAIPESPNNGSGDCRTLNRHLMGLSHLGQSKERLDNALAVYIGSSTIFPTYLNQLELDIDKGFRYELVEGQPLYKGRPYDVLLAAPATPRLRASCSLESSRDGVRPSSFGEHSSLAFTIRESFEGLELRTTAIVQGHSILLDLFQVLVSSMGLNDAPECEHPPMSDLAPSLRDEVFVTSIARPKAKRGMISIVQSRDNGVAQLLACEIGTGILLQRKCCLNCAVSYAREHRLTQIIVAC